MDTISSLGINSEQWRSAMGVAITESQGAGRGKRLPDGCTSKELGAVLGLGKTQRANYLRRMIASDLCEKGWDYRKGIDGKLRLVPVYRLMEKANECKRNS